MKILVTGAGGFVGTHLVRELAVRHEVLGVVRTRSASLDGVEWIELDLSQPIERRALPARIDAVIHLAQSRRYREFPGGAADMFAVNIGSTFTLLEYARAAGAQTFVFTSSGGVYGYSLERFVEVDPVSPLNFYFSSKYSAELLIANYSSVFNTVVLRPFFLYGPWQRGMLVPGLIGRVRRGEPIVIEGNPGLRINPLHIADAVRVFEPALMLGHSGLFNIAGDEILTITELVGLIGAALGRTPGVTHTESSAAGDLVGDNHQMKEVLGVVPRIRLEDGLRSVVAVAEAHDHAGTSPI